MTYRIFIENKTRIIVAETTDDSIDPPDTMTAIEFPVKIDHSQDNGVRWWKLQDDFKRVPASMQEISDAGIDPDVENQKQEVKVQIVRDTLLAAADDTPAGRAFKALAIFYGA